MSAVAAVVFSFVFTANADASPSKCMQGTNDSGTVVSVRVQRPAPVHETIKKASWISFQNAFFFSNWWRGLTPALKIAAAKASAQGGGSALSGGSDTGKGGSQNQGGNGSNTNDSNGTNPRTSGSDNTGGGDDYDPNGN